MPNSVAYAALLIWPFVTLAIFASMTPQRAVIWSLLAGYLLLPVKTSFDFPGVPAIDKTTVANLSTFLIALAYTAGRSARPPKEWWLIILIGTYLASPIFTTLNNRDSLMFGDLVLPGLTLYDAFSESAYLAIDLMPFLLGYNLLRSASGQRSFLKALAFSAVAYSFPMLMEIRLSPQLNTWIYGFFPHSFGQQVRGDGFRPVVFLGHGLIVAIFTAMGIVALAYLSRRRQTLYGLPSWIWLIYLFVVIILCKSLGALILAFLAGLAICFANRRTLQLSCACAAILVLVYPALRGSDLVPVQVLASQVAQFNDERADSFKVRIDNEDRLLARANARPWFGWGGYGRNRVFDEDTGKDLSVTDGAWVIAVGVHGWVGYIAVFGILCLPVILSLRRSANASFSQVATMVVLSINLFDLLPNSSIGPLTWLMAGAVMPLAMRGNRLQPKRSRVLVSKTQHRILRSPPQPFN
jgi:hypothetical protein